MKLKFVITKTIEVAAAGGAGLFAASALSLAIGGITLFAASPFISDSIESAIGQWIFKSGIVAGVSGLTHFACWEMYTNLANPRKRSDEQEWLPSIPASELSAAEPDSDDLNWDLDSLFDAPDQVSNTPSICLNCHHQNHDFFTQSDQPCLIRLCPEHPDFCPDWQPAGEVS